MYFRSTLSHQRVIKALLSKFRSVIYSYQKGDYNINKGKQWINIRLYSLVM